MIKYTQNQIITILNTCKSAVEILEVRQLLEETGHVLQCQAMIIYNANMSHFYETDRIV